MSLDDSKSSSSRESEYFDSLVGQKGDFNPFAERGWRNLSDRFTRMIAPDRKLRLLDVGCGTGQSRQIYSDKTAMYVAIDLAIEALSIAKKKFPESSWVRADACVLPFADDGFD